MYKRPYSKSNPLICMDESPKQLISETRTPLKMEPGSELKYDYEYKREGTCNIFMAFEPLEGKRYVKITQRKTKKDWAVFMKHIAEKYEDREKITIVMDNYSTHKAGSFYETFPPTEAKKLWDKFEFVYTPKHGSWLNMAEIELNVLQSQCLDRRIGEIDKIKKEVENWQNYRNNKNSKADWQFTNNEARIKLKKLYPSISI